MLVLFADTDCDITLQNADELGFKIISMPYQIDDEVVYPYIDFTEFDDIKFYQRLREGVLPKTFGLNEEQYKEYFEPYFKNGDDIIYVSFSTTMSGTFNSLNIAVEELKEKYPNATFNLIDSKGICANGYASLLEVSRLYKNGATKDDILNWAKEEIDHIATYFYADDLKFFARSGRVSNLAALMGGIIGIKPLIHMGADGKMTSIGKVKGKKAAFVRLLDYVDELKLDMENHPIIISNCGCLELAKEFEALFRERFGQNLNIEHMHENPTAGGHCGPDCIGITFHAIHR